MPMAQPTIEQLKERERLARIQYERAANALREEKRRHDARRKIIYGAAVLSMIEKGGPEAKKLRAMVEAEIKGKRDRKFLGLPDSPS